MDFGFEVARKLWEAAKVAANAQIDANGAEDDWVRDQQQATALIVPEQAVEYRFAQAYPSSQAMFCGVLKRFGIRGYRYRGQKRTTENARVSKRFVDELLWPRYLALAAVPDTTINELAFQVLGELVGTGAYEIEVRSKSKEPRLCHNCAENAARESELSRQTQA